MFSVEEKVEEEHLRFYFTESENSWGCDGELTQNGTELMLVMHSATRVQREEALAELNRLLEENGIDELEEL